MNYQDLKAMLDRTDAKDLQEILEILVDRHGITSVTDELAQVCYAKSEHVAENWQDKKLARAWAKIGRMITRADTNAIPQ